MIEKARIILIMEQCIVCNNDISQNLFCCFKCCQLCYVGGLFQTITSVVLCWWLVSGNHICCVVLVACFRQSHLLCCVGGLFQAITSGSIPGFVDVIRNFGSVEFTEDNFITQFKIAGRRMIFFGDDTWLSLFPHHFVRHDGTSSFYVTDFTEVYMRYIYRYV